MWQKKNVSREEWNSEFFTTITALAFRHKSCMSSVSNESTQDLRSFLSVASIKEIL